MPRTCQISGTRRCTQRCSMGRCRWKTDANSTRALASSAREDEEFSRHSPDWKHPSFTRVPSLSCLDIDHHQTPPYLHRKKTRSGPACPAAAEVPTTCVSIRFKNARHRTQPQNRHHDTLFQQRHFGMSTDIASETLPNRRLNNKTNVQDQKRKRYSDVEEIQIAPQAGGGTKVEISMKLLATVTRLFDDDEEEVQHARTSSDSVNEVPNTELKTNEY